MEELEKCPIYAEGKAQEQYFLGKKNVICSLEASECPYGKGLAVQLDGDPVTVCKSRGLLKKIELVNIQPSKPNQLQSQF